MKILAGERGKNTFRRDNSAYPVNTREMEDRERRNLGYLMAVLNAGT